MSLNSPCPQTFLHGIYDRKTLIYTMPLRNKGKALATMFSQSENRFLIQQNGKELCKTGWIWSASCSKWAGLGFVNGSISHNSELSSIKKIKLFLSLNSIGAASKNAGMPLFHTLLRQGRFLIDSYVKSIISFCHLFFWGGRDSAWGRYGMDSHSSHHQKL